jgi:hypothetical protein
MAHRCRAPGDVEGRSRVERREMLDLLVRELARQRGEEQCLKTVSTFSSVKPGRASVSTRPPSVLDRLDGLGEQAAGRRVDRAVVVVEPRAIRSSAESVPRARGSSIRHAGSSQRFGADEHVEHRTEVVAPMRDIGPATARSARLSVPGMPGIWPWAGTMP